MIRAFTFIFLFIPLSLLAQSQSDKILEAVKQNQILSFGGSDLLSIDAQSYIAGVGAVEVGTKKMSSLVRVGKVKAEREITTFVNGSDITSRTESYMKEELITINDSSYVNTVDTFVEYIREDSEGFVKAMLPAGYWYSEDKSMFFYAIYKQITLK